MDFSTGNQLFFQNFQCFTRFVAKSFENWPIFHQKLGKTALFQQKKKILKLLRYRGEDVEKMRSQNGEIENF